MTSRARMTVGIAALAGLLVGVWLLSPILTPFVFAAGLAYLGDPLVDRLEAAEANQYRVFRCRIRSSP